MSLKTGKRKSNSHTGAWPCNIWSLAYFAPASTGTTIPPAVSRLEDSLQCYRWRNTSVKLHCPSPLPDRWEHSALLCTLTDLCNAGIVGQKYSQDALNLKSVQMQWNYGYLKELSDFLLVSNSAIQGIQQAVMLDLITCTVLIRNFSNTRLFRQIVDLCCLSSVLIILDLLRVWESCFVSLLLTE